MLFRSWTLKTCKWCKRTFFLPWWISFLSLNIRFLMDLWLWSVWVHRLMSNFFRESVHKLRKVCLYFFGSCVLLFGFFFFDGEKLEIGLWCWIYYLGQLLFKWVLGSIWYIDLNGWYSEKWSSGEGYWPGLLFLLYSVLILICKADLNVVHLHNCYHIMFKQSATCIPSTTIVEL